MEFAMALFAGLWTLGVYLIAVGMQAEFGKKYN